MNRIWFAVLLFLFSIAAVAQEKAPAKQASPAPSFNKALLQPGMLNEKAPDTYAVKFVTTKGDVTIKVTRAWAPLGADRFYNLAKNGFFDGASFYRAVPGFMVQFGLSAYPQVNQVWANATIKDDPVKQQNTRGRVTFAMAPFRNSRSTQVFINYNDGNVALDSQGFAPFGEVTAGMEVVDHLYGGYGEATTNLQNEIAMQGKAFLDKKFPKLDSIKTATIVSASGPEPPAAVNPAKKSP